MADRTLPAPETLRQLLRYEPETGKLYWKSRGEELFDVKTYSKERAAKIWNTKNAGKEAFTCKDKFGYKSGRLFGMPVKAHRVAWAVYHGEWPLLEIDHADGNPANNKIANLRIASRAQNMQNTSGWKKSHHGFFGITRYSKSKKNPWQAQIQANGKHIYLGRYGTPEEAAKAYDEAAVKLHGDFARLNFPVRL